MTNAEFVCKIIEPTCQLFGNQHGWTIVWDTVATSDVRCDFCDTPQAAWHLAFQILDRRKQEQDRRQK